MKLFLQGCFIIASFFGLWIGLRQLDWISILHIKEVTQSTEEKLGELYWNIYSKIEKEETSKAITDPVDSLVFRIAKANGIDVDKLKIHVIRKDQINAFAPSRSSPGVIY
jgi:predicted Zn-dependent protease